jgi:hypothetical protein
MHRRLFAIISLVIVLSTALPVVAAPRSNPGQTVIDRIVLKLKKIFNPSTLDLNDFVPPKP